MRIKPRFRCCMLIGNRELKDSMKKREMNSSLLGEPDFIGSVDIWDGDARLYAFSTAEALERMLKEAKKIGFTTAGKTHEPVMIRNSDLNRPHLNRLRGYDFQREYYK